MTGRAVRMQQPQANAAGAAAYPQMPWHLVTRGATLISLHWVDTERARAWVPPEFRILSLFPGRTLGGLFLAEYGPGSDLQYNELIVACATVWYQRRPCAWITHLFVDEHPSVEGGRLLLGAPKSYASFRRDGNGGQQSITVGPPERPVCTVRSAGTCRVLPWRQRLRLRALHRDVRNRTAGVLHGNELRGRLGVTRSSVDIPAYSPLDSLGMGEPLLTLCAREVEAVLGGAAFRPLRAVRFAAASAG